MSNMKISEQEDESMTVSRKLLRDAMMISLGSYIEQEPKKKDSWRNQTYGQIYAHLKHEIGEIERSKTKTTQLHNAMDACTLAAIMVANLLDR